MAQNLFRGLDNLFNQARRREVKPSQVYNIIYPIIKKYAHGIVRNLSYINYSEVDDLTQEGLLIFWRDLDKYRYICPKCDERFEFQEEFLEHIAKVHESNDIKPKTIISSHLSMKVKAYLSAYIRKSRAGRRDARLTHQLDDDMDISVVTFETPETECISKDLIHKLKKSLDIERDNRIKIAIMGWLQNSTDQQIYQKLCDLGYCSSFNAARMFVYRNRGNRIGFRPYRDLLTCKCD